MQREIGRFDSEGPTSEDVRALTNDVTKRQFENGMFRQKLAEFDDVDFDGRPLVATLGCIVSTP